MIRSFKYLSPLTLYLTAWLGFFFQGFWVWIPLIYAFVLIPFVEWLIKPNTQNLTEAEKEISRTNKWYDWMLYIIVPVQYGTLSYFFYVLQTENVTNTELAGLIGSMGLLCGTFGINVAHELGHRKNRFEILLAKLLLATSLYMHFYIEHNKGHHKNVATPEDPSSARRNEPIYFFWFRTIIFSYTSAWKIAIQDCKKKGHLILGMRNEMIQAHLFQGMLIGGIAWFFGFNILCYFLIAAIIGILLLETVNYIEHYGLVRNKTNHGNYERALPHHSWNSSHPLGRVMLFELSRHSDHHYMASKKYQLLEHHEDAPQLPTGYPGSMLLSLIPPLWFSIMNKRISDLARIKP